MERNCMQQVKSPKHPCVYVKIVECLMPRPRTIYTTITTRLLSRTRPPTARCRRKACGRPPSTRRHAPDGTLPTERGILCIRDGFVRTTQSKKSTTNLKKHSFEKIVYLLYEVARPTNALRPLRLLYTRNRTWVEPPCHLYFAIFDTVSICTLQFSNQSNFNLISSQFQCNSCNFRSISM